MILTDLAELKRTLGVDPADTQEDANLYLYAEWASDIIQEYLNRPNLMFQERTEYYKGTGTQKLLLRSRPAFTTPTIRVWVDQSGYFGAGPGIAGVSAFDSSTELTHGQDFYLQTDGDSNASSRSGILRRVNGIWPKPSNRQFGYLSASVGDDTGSIKVTYSAGYTVDTLPARVRAACNLLVARIRYLFPLGMEIAAEGYEERSISLRTSDKDYLMGLIKPLLFTLRNWKW